MYYHGTKVKDIKVLEPHVSNHKKSLLYFSSKKENTLVYLSNAIEKYCKETGFKHEGIWTTWASYGFNDNILEIQEYYPNATYEVYKGVSGYIYYVKDIPDKQELEDIPYAYSTSQNIEVYKAEYISDAYLEIMKYVKKGKLKILKYEDLSPEKMKWIHDTILKEYKESIDQEDYRYFLMNKFPFLKDEIE